MSIDAATASLLVADRSAEYHTAPTPKIVAETVETLPATKLRKK
jgi:hypothetical protein